ncbi:MAG: hypothetical protein CMJ84_03520 [Planctomycetes bacterium]|jgi:hypothetical protein|nr:hypothetical protein [Planctomycetota bacterium]MDP6409117.1 hypothetical protein [Planctomycetota bacterium]
MSHVQHRFASLAVVATLAATPAVSQVAPSTPVAPPENRLEAGACTVDITPPAGIPMWGYGARGDTACEGVLDPLEANALVLAVGEEKLAVVGLDMGRAPARESMARIRAAIAEQAGVDHCMIVGSHTHHGPCLELGGVPGPAGEYVTLLEEKIVEAIVTADGRRVAARIGAGSREVARNRNRHSDIKPKPVDRELAVVRVDDLAGEPIAVAVNFAAHPTSIDASELAYSADYPGALKRRVRETMKCECLFLQGAAGDLSTDRGGLDFRAFGAAVGDEAVELARSIKTRKVSEPALLVREEDFLFEESRVDFGNILVQIAFIRAFFKDLVDFYVEEYAPGIRPHLTVALLNGEIGLVGASGEFFCSHAIRLKRRSRLEHTLFLGYCNDYQQYFPTIEAAAEGGYGSDAMVSPAPVGAGEEITNRALFHLYDMRESYRMFRLK